MSRRGNSSVAKNQMDLAIALSKSLEESKALTLSKLAEELPASVIEDDAVPQNILQMQKDFLERLQPKQAVPGKVGKQRKKKSTVVPTLLTRCPEERLRILTEKVALVLLMESPIRTSDDNKENSIPEGGVWDKSLLLDPPESYFSNLLQMASQIPSTRGNNFMVSTEALLLHGEHSFVDLTSSQEDWVSADHSTTNEMRQWVKLFTKQFKADWAKLLNCQDFSDVIIKTKGGTSIWAHTLVLHARCPSILLDVADGILDWREIEMRDALAFLEFVYCSDFRLLHDIANKEKVLELADKYNQTGLRCCLIKLLSKGGSGVVGEAYSQEACNFDIDADPNKVETRTLNTSPDIFSGLDQEEDQYDKSSLSPVSVSAFFGTKNPTVQPTQGYIVEDVSDDDSVQIVKVVPRAHNIQIIEECLEDSDLECAPGTKNGPTAGIDYEITHTSPVSWNHSQFDENVRQNFSNSPPEVSITSFKMFNNYKSLQVANCKSTSKDLKGTELVDAQSRIEMNRDQNEGVNAPQGNKPAAHDSPSPREVPSQYEHFVSPSTSMVEKKKYLDDSFECNINDSILIQQAEDSKPQARVQGKQDSIGIASTSGTKSLSAEGRELQGSPSKLDIEDYDVKLPVTPVPDYCTMTRKELQVEYKKFGLKQELTNDQGAKILQYIYKETHPLVKIILDENGEEIYLPIENEEDDAMDPPLQKKMRLNSSSSEDDSEDEEVLEESIMTDDDDDDEQCVEVCTSDLKAAIHSIVLKNPKLQDKILRYRPVEVEVFRALLKSYMKKSVNMNNFKDILDEECVTFRMKARQRGSSKKE